jgi:hypothetical protein
VSATVAWHWRPRERPLVPCAVIASGEAAPRLASRVLERTNGELARLRGVAGDGLVLLVGDADDLPWVDGVAYLGRDAAAPSLLVPTSLEPSIAPALFERAVLARAARLVPPVAVLEAPPRLVSTADARALSRERLRAFVERA